MICRHCKTAVSDADRVCAYCGKPTNSHTATKRILAAVTIVFLIAVCGLYLYASLTGRIKLPEYVLFSESSAETHAPEDPENPEDVPGNETSEPTEDLAEEENGGVSSAVWSSLEDAYLAGKSYIINNSGASFISMKGYLFDYENGEYVTTEDFDSQGLLAETRDMRDVWLLYINGRDLNAFPELNFSLPDKLDLFVACETTEGVAVLSENNYGVLYRENFPVLMEGYNFEFPNIYYPEAGRQEYDDVVTSVKAYEFDETDYDVRYLATDGKYSYIIFSKGADTNILYHYLLVYRDDSWQVVLPRITQADGYATDICERAFDLNFDLLPPFRADRYTMPDESYYTDVLADMAENGAFGDAEYTVDYLSGTEECVYFELSNGMEFVVLNINGQWASRAVSGYSEAYSVLSNYIPQNPPVFILRQENS